jgi:FkbM family methyltransferase
MASHVLSMMALPYVRRELPGWGRLMRAAGIRDDPRWRGAKPRTVRGKLHGYTLNLELSSWSERLTYFLGRFYELETQLALSALLGPGDWMVDVGANIGMITLLAAHEVGADGRVISFEPHPEAFARLISHLTANELTNVTAHQLGLADAPGTLRLSTLTDHTGMSTFAPIPSDQQEFVTASHEVRIARGDDLLQQALTEKPASASLMIKIDVEGFELRVLQGLPQTLDRHRPAVLTEFVPWHLRRAGSKPDELFDFMHRRGYRPWRLGTRRTRRTKLRHGLCLSPFDPESEPEAPAPDLLWLHDADQLHKSRVEPSLMSA